MQECSRSDPWIGEWFCGRSACLPCKTRNFLQAEEEQARADGRKPPDGKDVSLPGCSQESACYVLQCMKCRAEGRNRLYEGETSRSPFERGLEHQGAVDRGEADHPMVRHAWEEHAGQKPDFLMRVKSRHKKALDRLVQEAINIVSLSRGPQDEDLNSRSEWGQARVPRITMTMPHQGRPGSNPNKDSNPQFRVYLAAVNAAERAGGKRKVTID